MFFDLQNVLFLAFILSLLLIPETCGSRTEPKPEFYKPVLQHFFRTLTEPEP